jgi:predicted Zn-dependent protease
VLKDQERFAADQAQALGRPAPARGGWLASHPSNDQRLSLITELADQYRGTYADEGRLRYLKVVQGMEFGESASQGVTRGSNFYHPSLGFALTAPRGWSFENDTDKLSLVNAASDAVMVLRLVPAQAGKDPNAIIRTLLKPTQGNSASSVVNGLPVTHFVGARQTAQGPLQRVDAMVISGPGENIYLLQTAGKDGAAVQRARADVAQIQASFRALSAQDRTAARPWIIKTVAYPKGGFGELAKSSPLESPEKQLRLLNGFYTGGEPKTGQSVKVIERN